MRSFVAVVAMLFAGASFFVLAHAIPPAQSASASDFTEEERARLRQVFKGLQSAQDSIDAAEKNLLQLLAAHEARGDSAAPDLDPGATSPDEANDLFEGLPFDAPTIPSYVVPTIEECHWTISGGVATSTRGLAPITGTDYLIAPAYLASLSAGHALPITVGVFDNGGRVVVGGLYNPKSNNSLSPTDAGGEYIGASLQIVGLDDSCEVTLGWSKKWGHADYIGAFNIGLRGVRDSFIIRANDGIGKLIVDGCWWLPFILPDGSPQNHASGMHIDKWETLVWANHQFRGLTPTDPGTLFREHSAYLKSCVGSGVEGGTWIIRNDLRGGNRTGFQVRPDREGNPRPQGPIVIAGNAADGYGWTHESEDGGGCLTAWVGPESPVYVFRNQITDARYGCLVVSGQSPQRNWLNANGFPIAEVHVFENVFENRRAKRTAVSLSAIEHLNLYTNEIDGPPGGDMTLNAAWNMRVNGIKNGQVDVHGQAAMDQINDLELSAWDPSNPYRDMQLDAPPLEINVLGAIQ